MFHNDEKIQLEREYDKLKKAFEEELDNKLIQLQSKESEFSQYLSKLRATYDQVIHDRNKDRKISDKESEEFLQLSEQIATVTDIVYIRNNLITLKNSLPDSRDMGVEELKKINTCLEAGVKAISTAATFDFSDQKTALETNNQIIQHASNFYREAHAFYSHTSITKRVSNAGLRVAKSSMCLVGTAGVVCGTAIVGGLSLNAAWGLGFGMVIGATALTGGVALGIAAGCIAVGVLAYYLAGKVHAKVESNKEKAKLTESCDRVFQSLKAPALINKAYEFRK
jgi:hypothetical protein